MAYDGPPPNFPSGMVVSWPGNKQDGSPPAPSRVVDIGIKAADFIGWLQQQNLSQTGWVNIKVMRKRDDQYALWCAGPDNQPTPQYAGPPQQQAPQQQYQQPQQHPQQQFPQGPPQQPQYQQAPGQQQFPPHPNQPPIDSYDDVPPR